MKATKHQKIQSVDRVTYYGITLYHLDFFIGRALSSNGETPYTLKEIRHNLFNETGIRFNEKTIKKYNDRMKDTDFGLAPLVQVDDDLYVLNRYYFCFRGTKPPRPRKYELW